MKIVLGILVVLVAAGAWWALALHSESPLVSGERHFDLVVEQKKVVSGDTTLSVKKGDVVTITITVDEPEELHLHGYDVSVDLEPGIPATLRFVANITGRFMFEFEKSKTELGAVEVHP